MHDETHRQHHDDTLSASVARPRLRDGAFWFVLLSLTITSLLHYLTDAHLIPYHSVYRSFYYAPIAVAAVRYGLSSWRENRIK
jgi:hypothetical protein